MVKMSFLTLLLLTVTPTYALKYTIYTDESDGKKANEVINELKSTYPFNTFNIEYEIVQLPEAQLKCESKMGIERLVACETDDLVREAARRGSDQVMVVKKSDKWGGSAAEGGVPVITTGTSARAMIHEYLHVLGICDEYEYKAEEAEIYCNTDKQKPNLTIIQPLSGGYSSDTHARNEHRSEIPWYKKIKETTLITSGSALGTGSVDYSKSAPKNNTTNPTLLDDATGLYKGKTCKNSSRNLTTWHPGGNSNIMENVANGLGAPMEEIVKEILASKGARKRENTFDTVVNREPNIEVSEPPIQVNNTPRNFFKSFFEALGNFFKSIINAISK